MKKAIIFAIMAIVVLFTAAAQQPVHRNGNELTAVKTATGTASKSTSVQTEMTYTDKDGKKYPVYKSKNGKYFVRVISKKTGKQYNKYLVIQNGAK